MTNEPMPPPTLTNLVSMIGMPARATMSSVQTLVSISSWVRSPPTRGGGPALGAPTGGGPNGRLTQPSQGCFLAPVALPTAVPSMRVTAT